MDHLALLMFRRKAVVKFEKAQGAKDTAELQKDLNNAKEEQIAALNAAAARTALARRKSFELGEDIIQAYEVLDNLPQAQQTLVTAEMDRLKVSLHSGCRREG